jgi:hypothetical protein
MSVPLTIGKLMDFFSSGGVSHFVFLEASERSICQYGW